MADRAIDTFLLLVGNSGIDFEYNNIADTYNSMIETAGTNSGLIADNNTGTRIGFAAFDGVWSYGGTWSLTHSEFKSNTLSYMPAVAVFAPEGSKDSSSLLYFILTDINSESNLLTNRTTQPNVHPLTNGGNFPDQALVLDATHSVNTVYNNCFAGFIPGYLTVSNITLKNNSFGTDSGSSQKGLGFGWERHVTTSPFIDLGGNHCVYTGSTVVSERTAGNYPPGQYQASDYTTETPPTYFPITCTNP